MRFINSSASVNTQLNIMKLIVFICLSIFYFSSLEHPKLDTTTHFLIYFVYMNASAPVDTQLNIMNLFYFLFICLSILFILVL